MNRTAIAALLAVGALPLLAGDQTSTQAPPPAVTTTAPAANDSPLVAAAKAAAARNAPAAKPKKKIVINNENLLKTGGHISTPTKIAAPPLPKLDHSDKELDRLTAEQQKAYAVEKAAEAKAKKEEEDKKKAAAERANAIVEGDDAEGIYEDPATSEGRAEKQSPAPPTSSQPPTLKVGKPPA